MRFQECFFRDDRAGRAGAGVLRPAVIHVRRAQLDDILVALDEDAAEKKQFWQFNPQRALRGLRCPLLSEFGNTGGTRRIADLAVDDAEDELLVAPHQRIEEARPEAQPAWIVGAFVRRQELELLGRARRRQQQQQYQARSTQSHQQPLNLPRRFSKKAVSASWWSSVLWHSAWKLEHTSR